MIALKPLFVGLWRTSLRTSVLGWKFGNVRLRAYLGAQR